MRFGLICVLSLMMLVNQPAWAAKASTEHFTEQDMSALVAKLSKALKKCKPLRSGSNVIVDVENRTAEDVNRTRFSELIHSALEGQTHAKPEAKAADFEIHAVLEMQKQVIHMISRTTYTLRADVAQAEEILCKKKVKLIKQDPQALE